jgi:hypothetical protein
MAATSRLPLSQQIHCHDARNTRLRERELKYRENVINFRYNTMAKRGKQMAMHASPPTEDAVVMTEPLTKEDLVGYLASGCKQKEKWR